MANVVGHKRTKINIFVLKESRSGPTTLSYVTSGRQLTETQPSFYKCTRLLTEIASLSFFFRIDVLREEPRTRKHRTRPTNAAGEHRCWEPGALVPRMQMSERKCLLSRTAGKTFPGERSIRRPIIPQVPPRGSRTSTIARKKGGPVREKSCRGNETFLRETHSAATSHYLWLSVFLLII